MVPRTLIDYTSTTDRIVRVFGKRKVVGRLGPDDFAKLLVELDLQQRGRAFYALRHVFRTVADNTRDFPAIRLIMGHVDDSMDAVYTEQIDDSSLQAVVDHVHGWIF